MPTRIFSVVALLLPALLITSSTLPAQGTKADSTGSRARRFDPPGSTPIDQQAPSDVPPSRGHTVRSQLFRPWDFTNLQDYVENEMEGRFNSSTLRSKINGKGYPEITFSYFENGMSTEITIVDRGHLLEYASDTNPAFGPAPKFSPVDDAPEALVNVAAAAKMLPQTATSVTCGGLISTDNYYVCCGTAPHDGDCTFAAWELAKEYWGFPLPPWSDAGTWYDSAQTAGIPTSPTVALFSLAVSKTASKSGHVGLVTAVKGPANNRIVTLYEEQCILNGTSLPLDWRPWSIDKFTGYILNPAVNSQSITVYSRSPMYIYSSTVDQQVLYSANNIQGNLKALVTFPSGYVATLEPSAQIWIYGDQTVGTRMTLSEKGNYSI